MLNQNTQLFIAGVIFNNKLTFVTLDFSEASTLGGTATIACDPILNGYKQIIN